MFKAHYSPGLSNLSFNVTGQIWPLHVVKGNYKGHTILYVHNLILSHYIIKSKYCVRLYSCVCTQKDHSCRQALKHHSFFYYIMFREKKHYNQTITYWMLFIFIFLQHILFYLQDFTAGGYLMPAGHAILYLTYFAQRDPTVFESPDEFRPHRWYGKWVSLSCSYENLALWVCFIGD